MIRIETADAIALPIEAESVDCIVTSPPYLALRDYNVPPTMWPEVTYRPMTGAAPITVAAATACLGLEPTIEEYVAHVVLVARELARVLKKAGTFWLNIGDTYASAWGGGQGSTGQMAGRRVVKARAGADCDPKRGVAALGQPKKRATGVPRKNLLGIPWRVALALQDDGWYLRNEIIWAKRSPLPESCRDRATVSHEQLFLLTRRPRYYFNQEAWLEPCSPGTHLRVSQDVAAQAGSASPDKKNGPMKAVVRDRYPSGWDNGPGSHSAIGHNAGDKGARAAKQKRAAPAACELPPAAPMLMRNRRTVWTISSEPTSDAHYASFPTALVQPCIVAGCPPHGVVLDPFCGRGTTLLVANQLDCHAIGFDKDPRSIAMAKARVTPDVLDGLFAEKPTEELHEPV